METSAPIDSRLEDMLEPFGLFVRGGFHFGETDEPPQLSNGDRAVTAILIGNAGDAMWQAFNADGGPAEGARNPLDQWLAPRLRAAAQSVGAELALPSDGPPFIPLQDWAARAEPIYRSPIGIMIHPVFGLWHVYRGVLLFGERLSLANRHEAGNPCETCERKPCLSVCPVDAFAPDRFLAERCADHVSGENGRPCRDGGCLARRACPIGREHRYSRDAQAFHTAAMVRAVRRGFGHKG